MKSKCSFVVIGMDLDCPNCGQHVPSGSSHECEVDGGIVTVQTKRLSDPKPESVRALQEEAGVMPAEGRP